MPARCGVSSRLGTANAASWPVRGCASCTSIAAPPMRPSRRAASTAAVSSTGPRATLISTAWRFMRARAAVSTRLRVWSLSGQHSAMASERSNSVFLSTACTPGGSVSGRRVRPSTCRPRPWAAAATRAPMAPTPTMPSTLPASSVLASPMARAWDQPSARRRVSTAARPRRKCSSAARTYSTTAVVLEPGRLATTMPLAVAAGTGIMSRPTPWRTT